MANKETMTSRQRVLLALDHKIPDRVPIDLGGNQTGIHKFAYQALIEHLGIDDELKIMDAVQQLAQPCEELLERWPDLGPRQREEGHPRITFWRRPGIRGARRAGFCGWPASGEKRSRRH